MTEPLISVITPTFNRPRRLKEAIRSILNQEERNFEHLVVNDGGCDVSEVINSFSDQRLKCFNRPHKGKAAALNFALEKARGKYVAYLDDDDLLYPDHFSLLSQALSDNPDSAAAYSDTHVVYLRLLDSHWREVYRQVENTLDVDYPMLYQQNYINHKNIMHTREIVPTVGNYDEKLEVLIDWDFIRRLAFVTKLVHVREITSEYFRKAGDEESKTAIYFKKPDLFTINQERILNKLPKPEEPPRKTTSAKVNLKNLTKLPEIPPPFRALVFRSAPLGLIKKVLGKLKTVYPRAVIDIIGQPRIEPELRRLMSVKRVILHESGFFHPAHLTKKLLEEITFNKYQLGVIVFADRTGKNYQNVVGAAKVLMLPKLIGFNSDMELFSL